MTKYLTRRLKGFADNEEYMRSALPEKDRDAMNNYVEDSIA